MAGRFRVSTAAVSDAVYQVCDAIYGVMQPMYMRDPTETDWMRIERKFAKRWHFPNCIGAIDGKHVCMKKPDNSSSVFHNYKGYSSVVLMAIVDADYKFTYIDVGSFGSNADSSVFQFSNVGKRFNRDQLNVPPRKKLDDLPNSPYLPHCLVGDEAFPLQINLMRPYPRGQRVTSLPYEKRIFNYRLSRARRIVENAFGILAQRFHVFDRKFALLPENVCRVVRAMCILHNFLTRPNFDVEAEMARLNPNGDPYLRPDGALQDLPRLRGYRSPNNAMEIRDIYKEYFVSQYGAVPFQAERMHNM